MLTVNLGMTLNQESLDFWALHRSLESCRMDFLASARPS